MGEIRVQVNYKARWIIALINCFGLEVRMDNLSPDKSDSWKVARELVLSIGLGVNITKIGWFNDHAKFWSDRARLAQRAIARLSFKFQKKRYFIRFQKFGRHQLILMAPHLRETFLPSKAENNMKFSLHSHHFPTWSFFMRLHRAEVALATWTVPSHMAHWRILI